MSESSDDFRRLTARTRRERTGRRLVEALFEQADLIDLTRLTVDDVRITAEIARGTFYRHFPTLDALLDHVGAAVGAQINSEMSVHFDHVADPALRMGLHVRYMVRRAASEPVCAQLLLRTLARDGAIIDFARDHALTHFRHAVAIGRFDVPTVAIASDMGHGMVTAMLRRATLDGYNACRLRAEVGVLLRAFGLDVNDAERTAAAPLPRPPHDSLRRPAIVQRAIGLTGESPRRQSTGIPCDLEVGGSVPADSGKDAPTSPGSHRTAERGPGCRLR